MVSYLWRNNLRRRHHRLRPILPRCQIESGTEPAATSQQSRKVLSKLKNKLVSLFLKMVQVFIRILSIFVPKKFISVWIYSVSWTREVKRDPVWHFQVSYTKLAFWLRNLWHLWSLWFIKIVWFYLSFECHLFWMLRLKPIRRSEASDDCCEHQGPEKHFIWNGHDYKKMFQDTANLKKANDLLLKECKVQCTMGQRDIILWVQ